MRCQTLEVYLMVFTVKMESKPFADLNKQKKKAKSRAALEKSEKKMK